MNNSLIGVDKGWWSEYDPPNIDIAKMILEAFEALYVAAFSVYYKMILLRSVKAAGIYSIKTSIVWHKIICEETNGKLLI